MKLHIENIPKINMNVCFLSYFENTSGMNSPQIAIVNVNELMKSPTIAIEMLKYCDISPTIPTRLNGVLIARVDIIKMYTSILGLIFIECSPNF